MRTIPRAVIEKAIKGGWDILGLTGQMNYSWRWRLNPFDPSEEIMVVQGDVGNEHDLEYYATALDQNFWKALSVALKWSDREWVYYARLFHNIVVLKGDELGYWVDILELK